MNGHYDPAALFATAAPYYARYRAGYPPELFSHLVDRVALNGTQTVLDLGCGTGQIAIPLTPHVAWVIAVDPERTMLDVGRRLTAERGVSNINHPGRLRLSCVSRAALQLSLGRAPPNVGPFLRFSNTITFVVSAWIEIKPRQTTTTTTTRPDQHPY